MSSSEILADELLLKISASSPEREVLTLALIDARGTTIFVKSFLIELVNVVGKFFNNDALS